MCLSFYLISDNNPTLIEQLNLNSFRHEDRLLKQVKHGYPLEYVSPVKPLKKQQFLNPHCLIHAWYFVLCFADSSGCLGLLLTQLRRTWAAVPDQRDNQPIVGASYKNDLSPALRDVAQG